MNANIHLQGHCITFDQDEIQNVDGTFALLADIASPVTIPTGRFATIPTPIAVQGDGSTLALVHVMAGLDPIERRTGQFVVLSTDKQDRIVAVVRNETPNALVINPKNSIGSLEFVLVSDGEEEAPTDAIAAGDPSHDLPVPAIYAPEHIDATKVPAYATTGSSGFDLRADVSGTVTLRPGERMLVKTGLKLAIPEGYEAQVRARSGLAHKHGISMTNGIGTIDADYRSDIGCLVINHGSEPFTFEPGERIAQLVIAPVTRAALDFRDVLDDTVRGAGGFGSTGRG